MAAIVAGMAALPVGSFLLDKVKTGVNRALFYKLVVYSQANPELYAFLVNDFFISDPAVIRQLQSASLWVDVSDPTAYRLVENLGYGEHYYTFRMDSNDCSGWIDRQVESKEKLTERLEIWVRCSHRSFFLNELQASFERYRKDSYRNVDVYVPLPDCSGWRLLQSRPRANEALLIYDDRIVRELVAVVEEIKTGPNAQRRFDAVNHPFRNTVLLYGPPGTGKSSLVWLIASKTSMHIYSVRVSNDLSDEDIVTLLHKVPHGSIVLFEDFEVLVRQGSKLTLSGLLNVLDGLTAASGSIIFFTTNAPLSSLPEALLRPGRTNHIFHLAVSTEQQCRDLFRAMYATVPTADAAVVERASAEFSQELSRMDSMPSMAYVKEYLLRAVQRQYSPAEAAQNAVREIGRDVESRRDSSHVTVYAMVPNFNTWDTLNALPIGGAGRQWIDVGNQQVTDLISDVRNFLSTQYVDFCRRMGLAYRRGYMLYGPPGTGKSALVRHLACMFRMNIYYVDLGATKMDAVSFLRLLHGVPSRSIVLFEEFSPPNNAHNGVVHDHASEAGASDHESDYSEDKISIDVLCKAIDDSVSAPSGCLFFFTTNMTAQQVEQLSQDEQSPMRKLLRPGRIDCFAELPHLTLAQIKTMLRVFYPALAPQIEAMQRTTPKFTPCPTASLLSEIGSRPFDGEAILARVLE